MELFSKSQMKKPFRDRKCLGCIAGSVCGSKSRAGLTVLSTPTATAVAAGGDGAAPPHVHAPFSNHWPPQRCVRENPVVKDEMILDKQRCVTCYDATDKSLERPERRRRCDKMEWRCV
jgi:hypothetical protein